MPDKPHVFFLTDSRGGHSGKLRKTGSVKVCVPFGDKGDYLLEGTFRYRIGDVASYEKAMAKAKQLKAEIEASAAKPPKKRVFGVTRSRRRTP